MPIVITPTGQFINSETGNPVDLPPQRPDFGATASQALDPRSVVREGEMARENIPSNRDMGMDSMMPQTLDPRSVVREGEMSIEEKLDILMRMGLSQDEAIEAVALENSLPATDPSEFGGARAQNPGMGALGGVPTDGAMMPPPMPTPRGSTNMGMPEDAIKAQRMNQVDTTGLSPQQINMLRMGIDPFAEGMVR